MAEGFSRAHDALTSKIAAGPYQGGLYAGLPDFMQPATDNAVGYAQGPGQGLMGSTALTGAQLLGATSPFLDNATGLAAGGIGGNDPTFRNALVGVARRGAGPTIPNDLSTAIRTAGLAGANSLANGVQTLGQVQQRAMTDPTQHTIDAAGLFANNPALDSAIRSTQNTIDHTLTTQTLPGLGRSASLTGNLNSSRAGAAEAAALRDAAELKGNVEGTMRGQAFQNGLSLGNDQWKSGLDLATGAATAGTTSGNTAAFGSGGLFNNMGQFDTTARVGAATAGMGADTSRAGTDANVRLGANSQLGNAITQGVGAAESAGNQASGLYGLTGKAGSVVQGDEQARLNEAYRNYQYQNGGWVDQSLAPYWGITGTPLGTESQTTQSVTRPGNPLGVALGLGSLALTPWTGGFSFGNTALGAAAKGIGGLFSQ